MTLTKESLSEKHKLALRLLFIIPLLVIVGKLPLAPTAQWFTRFLSLTDVSQSMQSRLEYVLFVPLGAVLVVLFRLTLGIRVLGPFRSILLAVAFQRTGIPLGLIFLAMVIALIVSARPMLRDIRLPYFGRVSVTLSEVAVIIAITLVVGEWLGTDALVRVAYFPIFALCLTADGFAKTLSREGLRSALWRGAMTALVAVLIAFLSRNQAAKETLLRYPELLFVQIGCIVVIAKFFDFRLLSMLNPPVGKSRSRRQENASDSGIELKRAAENSEKADDPCLPGLEVWVNPAVGSTNR
ncbi:MAG TPA: 7TM domain-containing protein [Sedimentisphaerales bacterium]|nr:7TM domain-containing protein [Sedimentisphaerales bacterium]